MPHLICEYQCAALRPLRLPTFAKMPPALLPQSSGRSVAGSARIEVPGNTDLEEAALMEARRELGLLNQRFPALIPLAGLTALLGLPVTMPGMIVDFQQVAEGPGVPVLVRADEQRAFRYIVKLVEAVKCAGAVQLTIETELGS